MWELAAHGLSLIRFGLGPLWIAALDGPPAAALLVALAACTTDSLDGRVARLGQRSTNTVITGSSDQSSIGPGRVHFGALLDVAADGIFLLITLFAAAARGYVSPLLPFAALIALLGLALRWFRKPPRHGDLVPRRALADRIGHAAGVANYAIVVGASAIPLGLLSPALVVPASLAVAALNATAVLLRVLRSRR